MTNEQRRTYTVAGDTLHISEHIEGLKAEYPMKAEYSLRMLNDLIAECQKELAKFEGYRQRILAASEQRAGAVEVEK